MNLAKVEAGKGNAYQRQVYDAVTQEWLKPAFIEHRTESYLDFDRIED